MWHPSERSLLRFLNGDLTMAYIQKHIDTECDGTCKQILEHLRFWIEVIASLAVNQVTKSKGFASSEAVRHF